jgi:hypothetical protein
VRKIAIALLLGLSAAIASAAPDLETQRETWRQAISHTAAPAVGCFQASFPSVQWVKTACVAAPNVAYVPRSGGAAQVVGDGHDYAASVAGFMSASVGSFPVVSGVTSERDGIRPNVYSIQLNSNFMTTAACDGISGCQSWEQFVYSSSERSAFMQYWLINYGTCPAGWNTYSPDCYKNSAAVTVPKFDISGLAGMKLSGNAVANGIDTLVFTTATDAYSTSGPDSVVDLASDWKQSEFNIIGDGGGSAATFNRGSSITVKIGVTDGTTNAPTCAANAGTTGETNNLALQSCSSTGGASPAIQFVESD